MYRALLPLAILPLVLVVTGTSALRAAVLPDGRSKACVGAAGIVPESYDPSAGFAGQTTPLAIGPGFRITYGTTYLNFAAQTSSNLIASALQSGDRKLRSGDAQRAAYLAYETTIYHECAHARTADLIDEVGANCTAFLSMLHVGEMSAHDMYILSVVAYAQGANKSLVPEQFDGSAADYFDATMGCVNWATTKAGQAAPAGMARPLALDTIRPK